MPHCNACNKTVSKSEEIICARKKCQGVGKYYHLQCVGVKSDNAKQLTVWICPMCVTKLPRGDNSNTPVKNLEAIADDCSFVTIRDSSKRPPLKENTQNLKDLPTIVRCVLNSELSGTKSQISTIETTVNYISSQYVELIKILAASIAEMKNLKVENARLRSEVDAQAVRIRHLEEENSRQQQWSRLQNIEIVGVPESKDENTEAIVLKLAEKIGVAVDNGEVAFAHRVQARNPTSAANGRIIITRFRHRDTKDCDSRFTQV